MILKYPIGARKRSGPNGELRFDTGQNAKNILHEYVMLKRTCDTVGGGTVEAVGDGTSHTFTLFRGGVYDAAEVIRRVVSGPGI